MYLRPVECEHKLKEHVSLGNQCKYWCAEIKICEIFKSVRAGYPRVATQPYTLCKILTLLMLNFSKATSYALLKFSENT